MAAGEHQRIDTLGALARHDGMPRQRARAAIGEEKAGAGQLHAAHGNGALVEIGAQHMLGRVIELAEGAHEIGERHIAETGGGLGLRDIAVNDDLVVIGEIAQEAQDFADQLLRRMAGEDEIGNGDGAGIDEGIARFALLGLELDDGIEGGARGLATDAPPDRFAVLAERQRQREALEML